MEELDNIEAIDQKKVKSCFPTMKGIILKNLLGMEKHALLPDVIKFLTACALEMPSLLHVKRAQKVTSSANSLSIAIAASYIQLLLLLILINL